MTPRRVIAVVAVLAGVALLACGGLVAVFLHFKAMVPTEPPERAIMGTWQLDRAASSYNPVVQKVEGSVTLKFKKDGTYRLVAGGPRRRGPTPSPGRLAKR